MKKIVNTRTILLLMFIVQSAWVLGIWITRASENLQKLSAVGILSIVGFFAATYLRDSYFERIEDWIDGLRKNERAFLAFLFIVLLAGGIFYASQQRIWPFDETSNLEASQLVAEKGLDDFFAQYALNNYLSNRHPPLIFLINGFAMTLFGVSLMTLRMVSLVFGFAMLVTSYFLASSLYGKKTAIRTVFFLLTYPLIIRESTAGLLDVHATFIFTLALLLAFKLANRPTWKLAVGLGLSLGLGFLTKYMVMFILPVLFLLFLFQRNYRTTATPVFLSFSLAGILLLGWAWYGSQIGVRVPDVVGLSPSDLFSSSPTASTNSVPTDLEIDDISISPGFFITSEEGRSFLFNSLLTRLSSGLGAYNLPLILFGLFLLLHRAHASDWFGLMWVGVVSLLLVMTLPDHRYFMVIFPALAIAEARWTEAQPSVDFRRIMLLAIVYQIGTLYLMVDWSRANELFMN